MAQEKNPIRTESICRCGRKTEMRVGKRNFFIGTKKITLLNVPHFYCSYCDIATYDSTVDVESAVKFAYKNDIREIDWNKDIK